MLARTLNRLAIQMTSTAARRVRRLLTPMKAIQSTGHDLTLVVRPATTEADLGAALALRGAAYGRHFGHQDTAPDGYDFAPNALVLMAQDRASNEVLGTMRIAFGHRGPIEMTRSHPEPQRLDGLVLAEARRLVPPR